MSQKTNEEVVDEITKDPLFMDTYAFMTEKFPEVDKSAIAELLVVGVLYEKGMISRAGESE
jgi:hypothetical protein